MGIEEKLKKSQREKEEYKKKKEDLLFHIERGRKLQKLKEYTEYRELENLYNEKIEHSLRRLLQTVIKEKGIMTLIPPEEVQLRQREHLKVIEHVQMIDNVIDFGKQQEIILAEMLELENKAIEDAKNTELSDIKEKY